MTVFNALKSIFYTACCFIALSWISIQAVGQAKTTVDENTVAVLLPLNGAISPVSADFIKRGLQKAQQQQARVVILQLDTPGGLSDSTREIVQAILNAPLPVITYVAPEGARAASAGTYILYASHVAAMAPGTNVGAATPVNIAGGGLMPANNKDKSDAQKAAPSAREKKILNDSRAYIRSLAQLRKRNVQWAQQAVTQAASLSADEALQKNVIDVVADNPQQLLQKVDGLQVLLKGNRVTLDTQNLRIKKIIPDWRTQFLAIITHPSVAYILLMIGLYGLFFEFLNPGFVLPGVIGGIALLVAIYAFNLMPLNYVGLALLLLGLGFIIAEFFVSGFGILGLGGAVSFILGSVLLFKVDSPVYHVPIYAILGMAITMLLAILLLFTLVARSQRRKVVSGREALIGQTGIVEKVDQRQWVRVAGERWQCSCHEELEAGQRVVVKSISGLILEVDKI